MMDREVPEAANAMSKWRDFVPPADALQRVVLPAAIAALVSKFLYPLIALDFVPFFNNEELAILANDESRCTLEGALHSDQEVQSSKRQLPLLQYGEGSNAKPEIHAEQYKFV